MTGLSGYGIAFGCIFAVNLLPAFGPPTWAVLVFFELNGDLGAIPLVLGGALAAASGRLVLASTSRRLRGHLSLRRRDSLAAAERALTGNRRRAAGGLALFALSPVPSAQLFVAAGLLTVPLLPLTGVFFAGRLVSYSLYVGGSSLAQRSFGSVLTDAMGSPIGIALQVAMLIGVVGLVRIDWTRVFTGSPGSGPTPGGDASASAGRGTGGPEGAGSRTPRSSKRAGQLTVPTSGPVTRRRRRRVHGPG